LLGGRFLRESVEHCPEREIVGSTQPVMWRNRYGQNSPIPADDDGIATFAGKRGAPSVLTAPSVCEPRDV
jgi:hypothetical protein